MSKLQSKFSPAELRQYFSVDTTCENEDDWAINGPVNDSTDKIKCMPNAFPNAVKIVDKLYKTFNQMFFGSQRRLPARKRTRQAQMWRVASTARPQNLFQMIG